MAATAVYARITRVPYAGQNVEGKSFSNISATPSNFFLNGGRYAVQVKASTYGSVTLQVLGPDDTTLLTALAAFTADGTGIVDLPPGNYTFTIA